MSTPPAPKMGGITFARPAGATAPAQNTHVHTPAAELDNDPYVSEFANAATDKTPGDLLVDKLVSNPLVPFGRVFIKDWNCVLVLIARDWIADSLRVYYCDE